MLHVRTFTDLGISVEEEYAQHGFEEEHRQIRDMRTSYIDSLYIPSHSLPSLSYDYFTFYLFFLFLTVCFSHHYDAKEECRDIVCHVIM